LEATEDANDELGHAEAYAVPFSASLSSPPMPRRASTSSPPRRARDLEAPGDDHDTPRSDDGHEADEDENAALLVEEEEAAQMPFMVVYPYRREKIYWDLYLSVCVLWSTLLVPYSLGFGVVPSMRCLRGLFVCESLVDISFVCDIVLTFLTA
jgi:hypothetical protein